MLHNEEQDRKQRIENLVVAVLGTLNEHGFDPGCCERMSDAAAAAAKLKGSASVWLLLTHQQELPDPIAVARYGCAQLQVLRSEQFGEGDACQVAAALHQQLPESCRLILCPGDAAGEEVAALLAERLQTTWVADALTLAVTRKGALQITAVLPGKKLSRDFRADSACLVASMRDGVAEAVEVSKPAEVEVVERDFEAALPPARTQIEEDLPPDPKTVDLRFAEKIVAVGRGAGGPEGVEMLQGLASDLGASVGASRVAVDLGWIEYQRQVGQTGKTVRPQLYFAAGISGASHHLLGMRDADHIVALNPDREAPIHEVAHLSLYGDLHQVVPAIRSRLKSSTGSAG